MKNGFWILIVVVVVGMFGLFALTSDTDNNTKLPSYDATEIQLNDYVAGVDAFETEEELAAQLEGKVEIIEYGDFQCPACAGFYTVMDQIKQDFDGQIAVVFRHFPLTSIHPQAMAAHRAAVAAANQSMFWEMHDLLYETQASWSGASDAIARFKNLATDLELDVDQYAIDVDAVETFSRIDVDTESAKPLNITGTPSLLIDGELLENTPGYEELTDLINKAIAAKSSAPAETAN